MRWFVLEFYEWDWAGAEREYRRALELNPGDTLARSNYALLLGNVGRADAGIAEARHAVDLDPLSVFNRFRLSLELYLARRFDAAMVEARAGIELESTSLLYWNLGWALAELGRYEEAISEARKAIALSGGEPLYLTALAYAFAVAGDEGEAGDVLELLAQISANRHVPAYQIAAVHGALGNVDEGFQYLDRAFEERSPWIGYLRVDPRLDGLRSDSRFDDLLQKADLDF